MSTAPRILEVIYSHQVGGSEMVGLELGQQLARNGARVMCASLSGGDGPLRERCLQMGMEPVDLDISTTNLLGRNGFSLALVRRLRALELTAIHLHHLLALNKLGLPARMAGIPHIVVTEHSIATLRGNRLARLRARLNWRLAHHLTGVHAGIRDYLIEQVGVHPDRISVIPNGIDLQRWQRGDRSARRSDLGLGDEFVFMFVGRLAEVKNVPNLLRAFLAMQAGNAPRCRLIVVGDGPEADNCRAVLAGHPLADRVVLAGESADTRTMLAAADAFVMNSHSEGSPRAMIEAMALGLPCICPAVGGVPALLQGRGWLTTPESIEDLARAMQEVATEPEKSRAAGEAGRQFVVAGFDARVSLLQFARLLGAGS